MRQVMLLILFIASIASSSAQEKMQFSFLGGYEHINNNDIASNSGYGIGLEFKYLFYKKLYAVTNFHTGVSRDFKPRAAIAEKGDVDFSMRWKTNEYKAGLGLGINLLENSQNNIYTHITFGFSKVKYCYPIVTEYSPDVIIENKSNNFFKCTSSISVGYNYKIYKSFFIGLDYTGWWLIDYKYRHTCNAKIGVSF